MTNPLDMPQDLYDLYAAFGIAAEKAQLLETETGNAILCYQTLVQDISKISEEQRAAFKALLKEVNRKTLGAALGQLKSIGTFDPVILQTIDEGLELRNYLIHRFFRHHNFGIHSEDGRKLMAQELKDINENLHKMLATLTGITQTLSKLAGHPQMTADELQALVSKGRSKDV